MTVQELKTLLEVEAEKDWEVKIKGHYIIFGVNRQTKKIDLTPRV